jgi:hypothetical protein
MEYTIPGAINHFGAKFGTRHNLSKDIHQSSRVEESLDLHAI